MDDNNSRGKILIYGGSGGVGAKLASLLHQRGYDLHLVGRNEDKLSNLAANLNCGFTVGDVRDDTLFKQVMKDAGHICGLVYAVGTINLASIRRVKSSDLLDDFSVNSVGAALAVQAALSVLKKAEGRGAVVLFSSVAAHTGFALHSSISMAKGAVEGLVVALAAELAPNIRVNGIAPSLTLTPLSEKIVGSEQIREAVARQHPLQRLGEADDVARMAEFLVLPESDWITGQIFKVDGGRSTLATTG